MGRRSQPNWGLELSQAALAALLLTFLAHSAWQNTGTRLVHFVEIGTIAALVINAVWALVVVARVRVRVVDNAADAVVGDAPLLRVEITGPHRTVLVRLASSPGAQSVRARPPESGSLPSIAQFRGVAELAVIEVLWRGPLGLVGFSRRRLLHLARPLLIGPRPEVIPDLTFPVREMLAAETGTGPLGPGDVVRGVRDYVAGDPLRLVHWPATARTGDVVVKEVELPAAPAIVVVADLAPGGAAADTAASRAAWACQQALRTGYRVTLATAELGGPAIGPVTTPLEIGRRLARAVAGPIGGSPAGGAPSVLVVDAEGAQWRSQ